MTNVFSSALCSSSWAWPPDSDDRFIGIRPSYSDARLRISQLCWPGNHRNRVGNACWWNVSASGDNDDIIEIFTSTIVFMYVLDYVTQYQKHLESCVTSFLFSCQGFPLKLTLTLTIKVLKLESTKHCWLRQYVIQCFTTYGPNPYSTLNVNVPSIPSQWTVNISAGEVRRDQTSDNKMRTVSILFSFLLFTDVTLGLFFGTPVSIL